MNTRYFVLDTETSGLPPHAGVCEIGWIEMDADLNIVGEVQALIDPECPITPTASGVHGLVDADVADAPTLSEFFSEDAAGCYGQTLQADRIILCGHKVGFDLHFVAPYLVGEVVPVDTLRWSRHLYPWCEDHRLNTLRYALDLPPPSGNAHRVGYDIPLTYQLLKHLLQTARMTLDELAEKGRQPLLLHKMSFGKHKGEAFKDVPASYMRWALDNMDALDPDLEFTFKHYLNNN